MDYNLLDSYIKPIKILYNPNDFCWAGDINGYVYGIIVNDTNKFHVGDTIYLNNTTSIRDGYYKIIKIIGRIMELDPHPSICGV